MLNMRLAFLRNGKGWSQAELAQRIGVSASAVGMYEQGRREPSLGLVVRLAREFDVTTDYLLMGEDTHPATTKAQLPTSRAIRTEALIRLLTYAIE